MRHHDGLRAEGRSPFVGLRDSLRTAEKKLWGQKKIAGRKNYLGAEDHNEAAPEKKKKKEVFPLEAPKNTTLGRLRSKGHGGGCEFYHMRKDSETEYRITGVGFRLHS